MRKNLFLYFGIVALILFLSLIVYFKQAEFTTPYNASYWKDRFEHSQWALPLSRRDIGDDGIYAYAGYRLMHGASIEETNANKPPVGLYIIGASISVFHNPNIIILFVGILSLGIFYLIANNFIKDKSIAVPTVVLLAVNPMFFSHLWIPLIDLIQTFFLLCHILALIYFLKNNKYKYWFVLAAGIFLGLFTETKPPIMLPLIVLLEGVYLLYKRKITAIIIAALGFGAAVLIPYFRYFQLGHGLIDYVKLHKYMASIYYNGKNVVHRTSLIQAILIGKFPDISSGVSVDYPEWWVLLPVIWIGSFVSIIEKLKSKKEDIVLKGLGILVILTFILFLNVSSYPRYLLIVLPLVVLFFTLMLLKFFNSVKTKILLSICILVGLINMYIYLLPKPDDTLNRFYYNISNNLFQDIYQENLVNTQNIHMNQEEFREKLLQTFHQANITSVKFKEKKRSLSGSTGSVVVDATYYTQDIGTFTEEKTIHLQKKQEKWGIVWDWNDAVNGYKPGYTFSTQVLPGKRGTIYDANKKVIAQDTDGILISIDPSKIDKSRENDMLAAIEKVTKLSQPAVHNNYTENPISGIIYPIATNFYKIPVGKIKQLQSFPGVLITPHPARIYDSLLSSMIINNTSYYECCTRIYSPYSYHGTKGIELEKDKILSGQNGGSLVMTDISGKIVRTLINTKPKNGQDVTINTE